MNDDRHSIALCSSKGLTPVQVLISNEIIKSALGFSPTRELMWSIIRYVCTEYLRPPGGYNSVRDTIVLVNGQPMMVQPSSTSGTAQKLPGPSILKNSSKTDLITSQQV
ncbi:hypothetical protein K0M31_002937 [Melipona bicolor]|uniref:Uncharacterized protein n=1 Tax=Melipona bicolor TaxID=60889 RepID=A0AA40G017_9HYME|nr:hypothetical protein K0M31_002937 [Melipona bicolor]